MRRTIALLATEFALLAAGVASGTTEPKSLLEIEKPGIDKIALFSRRERATILFTLENAVIGYAKEGRVGWIGPTQEPEPSDCSWPHPDLSHDGRRVAFVTTSVRPKHCRIVIHDIATGDERDLIETSGDPGEISWSWDDSEIAFCDHGIWSVSVSNGAKESLLRFPLDTYTQFSVWYAMQWLHKGRDLIIEVNRPIALKEPGAIRNVPNMLLARSREARLVDVGSEPSVSPLSDQIAYYAPQGIAVINADGTGRAVLAKAPRGFLLLREELFGRIAWSPDGKRLFFGTLVSDDYHDKVYLLDVKSGRRETFASRTSINIRSWR